MKVEHLSKKSQAQVQMIFSLQWACLDCFKYENFSNRFEKLGFFEESQIFRSLAEEKKQQAIKELNNLLDEMIPAYNGYAKDKDYMSLANEESMILSALHSELDLACYLYPTVARKLRDIKQEDQAQIFEDLEKSSKQKIKYLQIILDNFLKKRFSSFGVQAEKKPFLHHFEHKS